MIDSEDAARRYVESRCDDQAMDRIDRFITLLLAESGAQNLVAKSTLDSVWQRHIADSAQLLDHIEHDDQDIWLDIGTGAGFPGAVIAIMQPERPVVLVEPRARRVKWLLRLVDELALSNCRVEGVRLEALKPFSAGVISARAVASLPKLIDIARSFSTADTLWLLPKGRSAAQELMSLQKMLRPMFHVEQSITDDEAGIVVGTGVEAKRQ